MRILLAVSGGIDSMYLANRAPELFPGASFAVAHCNFRLRGAESDSDEAFVRQWCAARGMECFVTAFDTADYATAHGISIEMAARELRYGWFADLCHEHGFDALATAHNANDNAETLLLNLLRGTGSRGARGMVGSSVLPCPSTPSPRRPATDREPEDVMGAEPPSKSIKLLRPMLGTSRDEITAWMRENGQKWHEDSTNALSEYKRNKLRNDVFPIFREINPSFIQTLGADMARFAQVDDIAEDYFQAALSNGIYDKEKGEISVKPLLDLKHWRYVLWRLLEACSLSQPTFEKLSELLQRYKECPSGTVTLSGKRFESPTHSIVAVGKKLRIEPNRSL